MRNGDVHRIAVEGTSLGLKTALPFRIKLAAGARRGALAR